MQDYGRIITKICETPWLMTPTSLSMLLGIVDARLSGTLDVNEAQAQMASSRNRRGERELQVVRNVGILPLTGPIFGKANLMTDMSGATSLETWKNDFRAMMADETIQSIIMQIDSPGGTSDMVMEVADEIRQSDAKPVYAIADTVAGSAAYWLMSAADKAFVTPSGAVGSIGVYTVHEDQSGKDKNDGRKFTYISAGPFKTEGNPHAPLTSEGMQYRQEVVNETYDQFVNAVASGRKVSADTVKANFGGGRMLTPSKALEVGMVDGIASFDSLLGTVISPTQRVSIQFDGRAVAGVLSGNTVRIEQADWEHSEPGTGGVPVPRTDENGEDDRAIESQSRQDPLPIPAGDPGAPSPNANVIGGNMDDVLRAKLCAALGLTHSVSDEQLVSTANNLMAEVIPMRRAAAMDAEETRMATEFPTMYETWKADRQSKITDGAKAFAGSVQKLSRMEGDKLVESELGLSALAVNTIEEAHTKFASGTGTLEDFESAIKAVTQSGVVNFGEVGSATPKQATAEVNATTLVGLADARKQFAALITDIQREDNLDYETAMNLAAKRHPELAAAYRQTLPIA